MKYDSEVLRLETSLKIKTNEIEDQVIKYMNHN